MKLHTRLVLPAVALSLIAGSASAQNVAARVAAAQKSGSPMWLVWSEPSATDGDSCCWNSRDSRQNGVCSLAGKGDGINISSSDTPSLADRLNVYVHVDAEGVDRIRVFSNTCRVDRGAERVEEVANVAPAESVSFLATLVKGSEDRPTKRRSDGALTAIALHDHASADTVLERVARDGETKSLRHSAAFWLGNARERAGYDALVRLRASGDDKFREHLTFCFSQSGVPEAQTALIDMAKTDPTARVRGQALFWIAQKAQKKSDSDVIRQAVENDPDTEIKKKAVFALSQIPHGDGVPDLIRVAKENRSHEVRKQAMFWLGQSKDPRALEFFEGILSR